MCHDLSGMSRKAGEQLEFARRQLYSDTRARDAMACDIDFERAGL
jgi:hypothetical protein